MERLDSFSNKSFSLIKICNSAYVISYYYIGKIEAVYYLNKFTVIFDIENIWLLTLNQELWINLNQKSDIYLLKNKQFYWDLHSDKICKRKKEIKFIKCLESNFNNYGKRSSIYKENRIKTLT